MNVHFLKMLSAFALLMVMQGSSYAVDSVYASFSGGKKAQKSTLGLQWNWDSRWYESNGTHIGGYWDANISRWRGNDHFTLHQTQMLTEAGITPVFRWQSNSGTGYYFDAGIGVHLISGSWDNAARQLSTHFQFGDVLAVGYKFNKDLDLALKLEHISNAGIKQPNSGMNFLGLRLNYRF